MGILDSIEALTGQSGEANRGNQSESGGDKANVAGGMMQALQEHPGGVQGVIDSFRRNGMGDHVDALANGQQQATTPEQVQQGLGGTGFIENVAQKAGVSPQIAQMAIAALMPMVIQHFAATGQTPGANQFGGGLAQQLLSRFL